MTSDNILSLERSIAEGQFHLDRVTNLLQTMQEVNTLSNAILDAMLYGLVVVDGNGTIIKVNAETEHLFGYQRHELIGEHIDMLLPESMRAAHHASCQKFNKRPVARDMGNGLRTIGQHKHGQLVALDIKLTPVRTTSGAFTAAVIRKLDPPVEPTDSGS